MLRTNPDERLRELERQARLGDREAALQFALALGRIGQLNKFEFPSYEISNISLELARLIEFQPVIIQPLGKNEVKLTIPPGRSDKPAIFWSFMAVRDLPSGPISYSSERIIVDRVGPPPRLVDWQILPIWAPVRYLDRYNRVESSIDTDYYNDEFIFNLINYTDQLITLWISEHPLEMRISQERYYFSELCKSYSRYFEQLNYLEVEERSLVNAMMDWLEVDLLRKNPDYFHATMGRSAKIGSGILFFCKEGSDTKILLTLRSLLVGHPNTWGVPGGFVDMPASATNVQLVESAFREIVEELGSKPACKFAGKIIFKDTFSNFTYTTFLFSVESIIKEAWRFNLNWENTDCQWFSINQLPENLHPGTKATIDALNW